MSCPETNDLIVRVKFLVPEAKMPYHGTLDAAGWDLYATGVEDKGDRLVYHTGIAVQIPKGHCGFLMPRSSVVKTGLVLGNSVGLIDADYTGEIMCVFYKLNAVAPYEVGDRVAQLVIMPVPRVTLKAVESLDVTERGDAGFGSTGGF